MQQEVRVTKKNGDQEMYSEEKVRHSMRRVGVPENLQEEVLTIIRERLYPGITTSEIFSYILDFVKEKDKKSRLRFNLKQSLFDLGPTGFPFEQYMARVFEHMGFKAHTNLIMQGECVTHEIDLMIEKDAHSTGSGQGKRAIVEAKFHNQPGNKTDVQVALYTYARFLDVREKNNIDGVWLVTNTRLTNDAVSYAKCKNIQVVGWSYPHEGNLQDLIEQPALYPITILTALSEQDKRQLLTEDRVLCRDIIDISKDEAKSLAVSEDRLSEAQDDARLVCRLPNT